MFSKRCKCLSCMLAGILLFLAAGCGAGMPAGAPAVDLTGAGSSFVNPLISRQVEEYRKTYPEVRINYQSTGSGAGINQLSQNTIDFGATDRAMTNEELKSADNGEILQIPVTLGAVAIAYNLPAEFKGLRLKPNVLSGIFLGDITKWNDPKIAADNPDAALPELDIVVTHRSDGSGTTNIFTEYLCGVSLNWMVMVGAGTSVNWPVGVGSKGNSGVTASILQTTGSIGYVEFAYAVKNDLPCARLQNKEGQWVEPSLSGVSAAAAAIAIPDNMRVSLVNAPGAESYPISGFSWVLLYKDQRDKVKGEALVRFLNWSIHEGQAFAEDLYYAALPADLVAREEAILKTVTSGGRLLLE